MRLRTLLLTSLLLVGALMGCTAQRIEPPAKSQAPATRLYVGLHTTDWEVRVKIEPLLPGERTATLTLTPHTGAIPAGSILSIELVQPAESGAPQLFEAKPVANGEYKVDALPLKAGTGRIRAIVALPGTPPQSVKYTFEVPAK